MERLQTNLCFLIQKLYIKHIKDIATIYEEKAKSNNTASFVDTSITWLNKCLDNDYLISDPDKPNVKQINDDKVKAKITELQNLKSTMPVSNKNTIIPETNINKEPIKVVSGTFTDSRDGKTYKTVKIGTQTWMAENLAYKASSGCSAYNNDQNNVATYGYLYTWEAAKTVCPAGWHLPTDAEWTTLTDYLYNFSTLGGEDVAGGKMKEAGTTHWASPNTGATNSSGFTALPAGGSSDGTIGYLGADAHFWSATEYSAAGAWGRGLYAGNAQSSRTSTVRLSGFRCAACRTRTDYLIYLKCH